MTIDTLPDVALLKIFDFYVEARTEAWYTLVQVCRKWRCVVFGSPRRLDLRLYCTASTPVRKTLDVWPYLPIVVWGNGHQTWGVGNIVAALEHNERICELSLRPVTGSQFQRVLAAMQQPFPALTRLELQHRGETVLVDTADSFLGGSAPPRLQTLWLDRIPFPGLPKLLLSATDLVHLLLWRIPHSGYISPTALATCLSALTRLERLHIGFQSPRSGPDQRSRRPPPMTRTLLPVLTKFRFKGVDKYLEDVVARIDAPLLDNLNITFFHQLIFDTPQLARFISRTPKFRARDEARVVFSDLDVSVSLSQTFDGTIELAVSCRQSDWQLSSLAQVCSFSFLHTLVPTVERLYIQAGFSLLRWQDDIEDTQWLELFDPFTAVKDLYLSWEFAPRIAPILQGLTGERVTEVLPSLQSLFLQGQQPSEQVQEAVGQFVAARLLSNHPISVSRWERTL